MVVGPHQPACLLLAPAAFFNGDGFGLVAQRFQGGNRGWQVLVILSGVDQRGQHRAYARGDGTGLQETATREQENLREKSTIIEKLSS